ncbi:hypothetical protein M409DRAFT_23094 [Zasmidium cellare ATCC 36951]|uniref:FAS1 domain-containing protein n=1 Tax=Zasmidium cellare ATCC 36951 TaxID=1080233 RepID=A0A6A6CGY5_ZASCE|nr:uncharacterized protein M409DRAFT_23094 [Zasmidium cellare ATCC 36951]KAF2166454.1 hypothetical protein M409DRAFT_23094 [Zasmidium cellare ATCC 36951]
MFLSYTAAALPLLSLLANAQQPPSNRSTASLTEVLSQHANLSSFQSLLETQFPAILKALDTFDATSDPITILAPNNDAFDSLVNSPLLSGPFANNDTAYISKVIAYHSIMGEWTSNTLNTSFQWLPTMTSGTNFSLVEGGQRVGGVLQPGDKNSSFYEWEIVWVSGESTRSVVTVQDVPFKGGFIQVLNNFLIPPDNFVPTAETYNLANYDYAITAFLGAVYSLANTTSLAKYINETQGITMFIPANVAFAAVSGTLQHYLETPEPDLVSILSYHVLSGTSGPLYSSDFANATSLSTLANTSLSMRFYPNSYFINQARIVAQDVLIYNGVFHVIDGVLSPDDAAVLPNPTSATAAPVLPTNKDVLAVNGSEAPFTTFMPNFVPTDLPDVSTTGAYSYASQSTYGAEATSSKKSEARGVLLRGRGDEGGLWFVLGWVGLGLGSAVVFFGAL